MLQVLVGVGIWLTPPRRLARLKVDFDKRPRLVVIRLHQLAGVLTSLLLLTVAFTGLAMYWHAPRSEEHTSELQSLMRNSYAVFCLKKKKQQKTEHHTCIH